MDTLTKTPGAPRVMLRRRHAYVLIALAALTAAIGGCSCSDNPVAPVVPLPPLSAVVLTPPADSVLIGDRFSFTAAAYDTLGALVPGATFAWTSSAPNIFTVSSTGIVTGVSEGTGELIASAGGFSDTSLVTVFPGFGWFLQSSASSANLNGVFFLSDGRTGWAVGNAGTIRKTMDAGNTWVQQISNTSFNLRSVQFPTSQRGCACGGNGIVVRTTDGGTTWSSVTTPASGFQLNDLYFANANLGWAVGNGGVILRTTDGGASWTRYLPSVTLTNLLSVAFSGTDDGWAVGDNGIIVGTHDGGDSWYIYQPSVTTAGLDAVWRRSLTQAWAVGRTGATLGTIATTDSLAWNTLGVPNYQLYGVHFPSDLTGYAVGFNAQNGSGLVVRTDDGGPTLDVQDSHTSFRLNDVYFSDTLHGWAVGNGGTIIHTATGGRP